MSTEHFKSYLLAVLLVFSLSFCPPRAEAAGDYNVVLIFIDTLRADHLSCYGYPKQTSPNIDRLAGESVVFTENFSPISYTLPGFMSIITSLYPDSHGVLAVFKDKLSMKVTTLAEVLHMYGYKTAWFGPSSDPQTSLSAGYGRGFDETPKFPRTPEYKEKQILCDWLEANKDKKFFLNFHTYRVHAPYFLSLEYKQKFTKEKMEGIPVTLEEYDLLVFKLIQDALVKKSGPVWDDMGDKLAAEFSAKGWFEGEATQEKLKAMNSYFLSNKQIDRWVRISKIRNTVYFLKVDPKNPAAMSYLEALYDGCILEYDAKVIGPVMDKLKSLGLYDKTIVIICADHGEEFGEHGHFGHGSTLYDEVIHVPLIMHFPGQQGGKKIDMLTSNVDIMPTLLDLLDIPVPHQAQGKSLKDFIYGKKTELPYAAVLGQLPNASSLHSAKWKLVVDVWGSKNLYDLSLDPGEKSNVFGDNLRLGFEMEAQLKKWETSLPFYGEKDSFPPGIDEATKERIKKTGYW